MEGDRLNAEKQSIEVVGVKRKTQDAHGDEGETPKQKWRGDATFELNKERSERDFSSDNRNCSRTHSHRSSWSVSKHK